MITFTRAAMPSAPRLAALWFGVQALWGALLGISLQARATALHPHDPLIAYGQLATLGALTATIVQIIVGPLSDRRRSAGHDRRLFLIIGTALGVIGLLGFYLAPTFATLVAATIFLQFGVNICIGPYQAVVPDYFEPQDAGRASSWMAALQGAGNACGALAATFIASPLALAGVLAAVLAAAAVVTITGMAASNPRPSTTSTFTLSPAAVDLFVSRAILWIGFYTILGYMFFYVRDALHSIAPTRTTGITILIFTVTSALGAAISGRPADRFDRRLVVNAGTIVVSLALLAFIVLRDARALYITAAFAGIGWGAFLTADWALGCIILPRNAMATAMGIWNVAVAGAQIAAPAVATGVLLLLHPLTAKAPLYALGLATVEVALGTAWIWRLPRLESPAAIR